VPLDEAVVARLAAARRKPDTIPRAITGALNQVTFPSLERPKQKHMAPMTMPALTGPVAAPQPEPMAPEPAPMDEFDLYAANTQGGGW
jgi:hypothetical protein